MTDGVADTHLALLPGSTPAAVVDEQAQVEFWIGPPDGVG